MRDSNRLGGTLELQQLSDKAPQPGISISAESDGHTNEAGDAKFLLRCAAVGLVALLLAPIPAYAAKKGSVLQVNQYDSPASMSIHDRFATCWHPQLKGLTVMTNSLFNGWRMEDVWLDK
jgi:hypothetical protein